MLFVKPGINPETGQQFRVRIPHTFALMNPEGEEVPSSPFWLWMVRHKDVVETSRPEPEPPAAEAKAEEPAAEATATEHHAEAATQAPIAEH